MSDWEEEEPVHIQSRSFTRGRGGRQSAGGTERKGFDKPARGRSARSNLNGNWRSQADNENLVMTIDSNKVGRVIGRGGAKIRELQDQSGATIKIGEPNEEDHNMSTDIIISGSEGNQKKCKALIEELINHTSQRPELVQCTNDEKKDDYLSGPLIDWDQLKQDCATAQKARWAKCPVLKKDFYFEDPQVAGLQPEIVDAIRKEKNNIVVKNVFGTGDPVLNPITTFEHAFSQYPEILREIRKQKFETPSPIQCQAWPILLSGRDMIGIAQTGTGKTLAFLLPALIHIDGQETPRKDRGGANVLIMAPTRELALQIEQEVKKYSYKGIKCVCVYGGGNRREQMNIVTAGVEIIIATPGRLNDLVEAGVIDVASVTYLVLDEADRMLDMGFEPQIRKTLLDIRPDRQSIMTSATWPEGVRRLAERYMVNPVQVFVGSLDLAAVHSVTQTIIIIDDTDKRDYLRDLLARMTPDDKAMVFVGRKTTADDVSCELALDHVDCQCIHGDREQSSREEAIDDIKKGVVRILIATDVASRGIDITDITKVINYDFPRNIEEYVHRVGRTGRAGRTGEAITFFTRGDWASAAELIVIMEEANQSVPQELYDMKDRYAAWKKKRDEERSLYGGSGGGGGRGGRGGRQGGRGGGGAWGGGGGGGGGWGGGGGGGRRGGDRW